MPRRAARHFRLACEVYTGPAARRSTCGTARQGRVSVRDMGRIFTDSSGHRVDVPESPRRIVSLVPSVTETLFALGLQERLAGRTRYCDRPRQQVEKIPACGGTKNPDLEAIAALQPDLILVNTEENRLEDIEALRKIAPTYEDFPRTVAEGATLVRTLGQLTGSERKANEIAQSIEIEMAGVKSLAARFGARRKAAYFIWKDPWMSINKDTYIHDMLTLAGLENVYADRKERYPETDFEELARLAPDIVLLSSEPYPFKLEHRNEFFEHEEIPAGRMGRIYVVDGTYFCWYGVRQLEALRWIRSSILA